MTSNSTPKRRIVSSRHLADSEGWEASEVEYGMIIAYNAFSRWMTRCMSAAGNTDLTPLEILVLHNTNHRGREKRLTDLKAKVLSHADRLKEYRSALITAAVTGQIDVKTYAKSGTPDGCLDAIQMEMGA